MNETSLNLIKTNMAFLWKAMFLISIIVPVIHWNKEKQNNIIYI